MKDYVLTKMLGVIVGSLTILGALGFGFLALLGTGLSRALNANDSSSSIDSTTILIFISILILGLVTIIAPFRFQKKAWRTFYSGFCFLLGVIFVVAFFISFGALGTGSEIFILIVGIIYICLGYLAKVKL